VNLQPVGKDMRASRYR